MVFGQFSITLLPGAGAPWGSLPPFPVLLGHRKALTAKETAREGRNECFFGVFIAIG